MNKEFKQRITNILIALLAISIYFLISIFRGIPFKIFNIDISILPTLVKEIYILASEILTLAIICLIYHKHLEKAINEFKKDKLTLLNRYVKYWLIGLIIMFISNIIISMFYNSTSANEEIIRTMTVTNPLYTFISAVLIAPILEELTFRLTLKNIFKNKYLFIIISGLIFGYLHVMSFTNPLELLYIIPYGTLGSMFAYMLYESDNILVPTMFHFFHNGILLSLQFFTIFFT